MAGVSLITQALYAAVFCTRYLDIFWVPPKQNLWNFVLKNFYILSSLYIILLMMKMYARTREREKAWKFGAACMAGSLAAAPFAMMIFEDKDRWGFVEVCSALLLLSGFVDGVCSSCGYSLSSLNLCVYCHSSCYFVKQQYQP